MRSSLIRMFGNWRSTMKISHPCGFGLLGCSSLQEMAEALEAIAVHFEDRSVPGARHANVACLPICDAPTATRTKRSGKRSGRLAIVVVWE